MLVVIAPKFKIGSDVCSRACAVREWRTRRLEKKVPFTRPGKHTKKMENHDFQWVNPL